MNLAHALPHDDTSTEFHTEAGPFTLVPLPGHRSSLVWVDRPGGDRAAARCRRGSLAAEIEARSALDARRRRDRRPAAGLPALRHDRRPLRRGRGPCSSARRRTSSRRSARRASISAIATSPRSATSSPRPGGDPGTPARLAAYDRARRGRRAVRGPPRSTRSTGRCSPASCRCRRSAASACSCSTASRRSARRSCARGSPGRSPLRAQWNGLGGRSPVNIRVTHDRHRDDRGDGAEQDRR